VTPGGEKGELEGLEGNKRKTVGPGRVWKRRPEGGGKGWGRLQEGGPLGRGQEKGWKRKRDFVGQGKKDSGGEAKKRVPRERRKRGGRVLKRNLHALGPKTEKGRYWNEECGGGRIKGSMRAVRRLLSSRKFGEARKLKKRAPLKKLHSKPVERRGENQEAAEIKEESG